MSRALLLALSMVLVAGCGGNKTDPPPVEEPPVEPAPVPTPEPEPEPQRCGGIAGLVCPEGMTCVDDPGDDCDPGKGGADCMGLCTEAEPGVPECPNTDTKRYLGNLDTCKRIRFACAEGEQYFSDDCGCGCEKVL